MRVMIYAETTGIYQRMREQLGIPYGVTAHGGIQWVSEHTAIHKLMGIARGTLLMLTYRCTEFTPEMLELIATRQIIVVPVHCSKCSNYGAVVLDTWEREYAQELEAREHQALKGEE